MIKRLLLTLACAFLFYYPAVADTQSQALVADGRVALFNHGNPTCSGIIQANSKFAAAVAQDASDPEANLFYALTRLAVMGLETGSGSDFETLLDVLNAFGITRNTNDYPALGDIYTEPPFSAGVYQPPATVPLAGRLSSFLTTTVVALLDDILGNLAVINNTIAVTLTPDEIGEGYVEIDYGDVLLYKSSVEALKGYILTLMAYNLDGIDTAEMFQLGSAGIFQIQRDLLEKYPDALRLVDNGQSQLSTARDTIIAAAATLKSAITFIEAESDDQNNDLFSFDEEDLYELKTFQAYAEEFADSLVDDRPAEFEKGSQRWHLVDEDGRVLYIDIDLEMGRYDDFNVWRDGYEYPPPFKIWHGEIQHFEISGDQLTIEMEVWSMYNTQGTMTFTATLNESRDTIDSGTFSSTAAGCYDDGAHPFSGSCVPTEGRDGRNDTWVDRQDYNAIFGVGEHTPLDIKNILPEFTIHNQMVRDSFAGTPVLNGFLPDMLTNRDITLDLNLQPDRQIEIKDLAVTIDGLFGDWASATPVLEDEVGEHEEALAAAMDIKDVYMAKDTGYLYVAMTFENGTPPNPESFEDGIFYEVYFKTYQEDDHPPGTLVAAVGYDSGWGLKLLRIDEYGTWHLVHAFGADHVGVGTGFLEFKIPSALVGTSIVSLEGKYLSFKTATYATRGIEDNEVQDYNPTHIMITEDTENLVKVQGSITNNSGMDGNILITLFSSSYGPQMSNTWLDAGGQFSLVPTATTYDTLALSAFQDVDGNGIWTVDEPVAGDLFYGLYGTTSQNLILIVDQDLDGIADALDAFPTDPSEWLDTDSDGTGDNADTDDDGDGMPDEYEIQHGLDPKDDSGLNGADGDLDGDSVPNYEEMSIGTLPNDENSVPDIDADFDHDGRDLSIFVTVYQPDCTGDCDADLNRDNLVDKNDIAWFAKRFGIDTNNH